MKVCQKDYKMLSIYKIYGRILTQVSEAPPPGLTLVVSSTSFISLADLKSPSKALDRMSDSTDEFWFHQFGAICGERLAIKLFLQQRVTQFKLIDNDARAHIQGLKTSNLQLNREITKMSLTMKSKLSATCGRKTHLGQSMA